MCNIFKHEYYTLLYIIFIHMIKYIKTCKYFYYFVIKHYANCIDNPYYHCEYTLCPEAQAIKRF